MTAHIAAPSNPSLSLCQEWAMRRGEYDDSALVMLTGDPCSILLPFADLVAARGLEAAIRDCRCAWLAPCEIIERTAPDECTDCREVARS